MDIIYETQPGLYKRTVDIAGVACKGLFRQIKLMLEPPIKHRLAVNRRSIKKPYMLLAVLGLTLWLTACISEQAAPAPIPELPTPGTSTPVQTVSATETIPAASVDRSKFSDEEISSQVLDLITAVSKRTPVPTPAPDIVDQMVADIASQTGLASVTILGLPAGDWINILASLLLFIISLAVIIPLLFGLITWGVRRTETRFDDEFFNAVKRQLSWLVISLAGRYSLLRLTFLGEPLVSFMLDLFFVLNVTILSLIGMRLVTFSSTWGLEHLVPEENRKRLRPAVMVLRWLGFLIVLLVALTIVAAYFGVNVTFLATSFLFGAVIVGIIGVAAQTAITDTIYGFMILIDQPFRPGDILRIPDLDVPGEIISIGLRSTRMRTFDNREIILPNSLIGTSQVTNYSLPDSSFRQQFDTLVEGAAFDRLQEIIENAVRGVEGVLPDKPVDVIYLSFGGSAREIRIRWWIDNFRRRFFIQTSVFETIEQALDVAGIKTPNPLYDIHIQGQGETGNDD